MRNPRQIKAVTEVALADIHVGPRLREVDPAGVEGIRASLAEGGVLLNPITIRKVAHQEGRLELVAGRHRVEAARLEGWETIPATVWDCSDDWARLMELHENLGRRDLNALDRAVFMSRAKALYESMYPETKRGIAGAKGRWNDAAEPNSVACFTAATAEATGMTERQVRNVVAAGQHLSADEIAQLRAAPVKATLADLQQIAKMSDRAVREAVIARMHAGAARSAAKALKAVEGKQTRDVRSPEDKAFDALKLLWDRAPVGLRRRFRSYIAGGDE